MYGKSKMTYNIHLLSHLTQSVQHCGPLWSNSNFCYESMNGRLVRYINGPTDVIKQIASKYALHVEFRNELHDEKFCQSIRKNYIDVGSCRLIQKLKQNNYSLPDNVTKIASFDETDDFHLFKKLFMDQTTFCIENLQKRCKSIDSFVMLRDQSYGFIKSIIKVEQNVLILIENRFAPANRQIYSNLTILKRKRPHHFLYKAEDIQEKLVFVKSHRRTVCVKFPNTVEMTQ